MFIYTQTQLQLHTQIDKHTERHLYTHRQRDRGERERMNMLGKVSTNSQNGTVAPIDHNSQLCVVSMFPVIIHKFIEDRE